MSRDPMFMPTECFCAEALRHVASTATHCTAHENSSAVRGAVAVSGRVDATGYFVRPSVDDAIPELVINLKKFLQRRECFGEIGGGGGSKCYYTGRGGPVTSFRFRTQRSSLGHRSCGPDTIVLCHLDADKNFTVSCLSWLVQQCQFHGIRIIELEDPTSLCVCTDKSCLKSLKFHLFGKITATDDSDLEILNQFSEEELQDMFGIWWIETASLNERLADFVKGS